MHASNKTDVLQSATALASSAFCHPGSAPARPEGLRKWIQWSAIDSGRKPGVTTDARKRIDDLERENFELRWSNEILRNASAYFALAGLDPPTKVTVSRDMISCAPRGHQLLRATLSSSPASTAGHSAPLFSS